MNWWVFEGYDGRFAIREDQVVGFAWERGPGATVEMEPQVFINYIDSRGDHASIPFEKRVTVTASIDEVVKLLTPDS